MKYFKLMRTKHYIKNLMIFIPLLFSGHLLNVTAITTTSIGFLAFCLSASLIYIINDIKDVENDRKHPIKKKRPIASGTISIKQAYTLAAILTLIITMIYIIAPINKLSIIILIIYVLTNVGYSLGLKNIPIIDVVILVLGFLLRIIYGAMLCNIFVSDWLYLTILVFAFFMGFGKRRNELRKNYNYEFLDKIIYTFITLCITFYSLWAMASPSKYMIYTTFLLIIILLKYTLKLESDSFGDPVDMLLEDKILLIMCIIYTLVVVGLLYIV